jgi:sulfur relay protein TusB/DsrH
MKSVLVWINSAPSSSNLTGACQLAQQMRARGRAVSIFLAQDAVLAGIKTPESPAPPLLQALQAGITTFALSEDLMLRGFAREALWEGIQTADYTQLVDLFDQHEQVLGAL